MSDSVRGELDGVLVVHTLDEAAAFLRVKKSWLERQAAARRIPFTMLGGTYHFTSLHLLVIVRLHEVEPDGPQTERGRNPGPARQRTTTPTQPPTAAPLRARPRTGPRRAA